MEDEAPPESLLPYDVWMEESLRHVVLKALGFAAGNGLPGKHHFYITFRTDIPGVTVPDRLREKYPHEMTIVLQHQFSNLHVDHAARSFGVSLSFGGIPANLSIPVDAVSAFADPSIQYALRFRVDAPEPAPQAAPPPEPPATDAEQPASDAPQVVSLDAFRKRRE